MFVEGVVHTVAEQGEQLAWLVAALSDSEGQEITYSKPSISKLDTHIWGIWAKSATLASYCTSGISTLKQLGWFAEGIIPVIAQGFPTFRHQSPSSAIILEVSQMVMMYWRPLHLPERGPALELVGQRKASWLWHAPVTSPCRCTGDAWVPGTGSESRHFVDVCRSSVLGDMPGSTPRTAGEPQAQEQDIPGSPSTAAATCFEVPTPSSAETPMDSDMLSVPDSPEAPLRDIPDQLSTVIDAAAARLLHEYRTGAWRRTLLVPGMPESDSTTELCPLDPDDGASGAASVRTRPQSQGEGQQQDAGRVGCHASSSAGNDNPATSSGPSHKRAARDLDGYEDDDDGQGDMPPPKKVARGPCPPAEKPLACPYWKLDPRRYRDCGKKHRFREIKRIKQHLSRSHCMPDINCDRCRAEFPDEQTYEKHRLDHSVVACVFAPLDPDDHRITKSRKTKLEKKAASNRSVYERWYDVWEIIFPGRPQPSSPYLDTGITANLCDFREYARARGRQVLFQELVAAGFQAPSTSLSEETLESYRLETTYRALDSVIGDFLSCQPSGNAVRSSAPSGSGSRSTSEISGQATNVSAFADSGISVRGQPPIPRHGHQDASYPESIMGRLPFQESTTDSDNIGALRVAANRGTTEINPRTQTQAPPRNHHNTTHPAFPPILPRLSIPSRRPACLTALPPLPDPTANPTPAPNGTTLFPTENHLPLQPLPFGITNTSLGVNNPYLANPTTFHINTANDPATALPQPSYGRLLDFDWPEQNIDVVSNWNAWLQDPNMDITIPDFTFPDAPGLDIPPAEPFRDDGI